MKKKSVPRITVLVVIIIIGVLGYYSYLVNRNRNLQNPEAKLTPIEAVLIRNLDTDYPATPKEVMKYYNEITKCIYNQDHTEEQLIQLAEKIRMLYDRELLEQNDWDTYITKISAEVLEFKDKKRRISSFSVAASINVDYFTEDGYSFAKIQSSHTILEGKASHPVKEVYLLRKDSNNCWKIYGWDLASNLDVNKE